MKVKTLDNYTSESAARIRELMTQLSRSGKDRGEITKEWLEKIIASPYHDILIATDDSGKIIGIASLSIIVNLRDKKAYLEDFVTDTTLRGQGIGSALWDAMLDWSRRKGCTELIFTSGYDREAAHRFYLSHDAKIYDTAFFRKTL
ncbi:GNAT family N-acetyltransferase [Candidatus Saccharibacteria bacterium]|nr:GNAT family N-acetyltransferase [Candidatus Saccharibacteria bacterium]